MKHKIEEWFDVTLRGLHCLYEGDGQGDFPEDPRFVISYPLSPDKHKDITKRVYTKGEVVDRIVREQAKISWVDLTTMTDKHFGILVIVELVCTDSPKRDVQFHARITPRSGWEMKEYLEKRRASPFEEHERKGALLLRDTVSQKDGEECLRIEEQWPDPYRNFLYFKGIERIERENIVFPCRALSASAIVQDGETKCFEFQLEGQESALRLFAHDFQCFFYLAS